MVPLKQEVIDAISKMQEPTDIDDIMYRLYVIDKIRKGREAAEKGEVTPSEELRREIERW